MSAAARLFDDRGTEFIALFFPGAQVAMPFTGIELAILQ
jgi:hypothetical protein